MKFEFKLPDLGEGTTEVDLRKWLVREGESVSEHQPVLEVESDKAVVQVPSPRSGRVERLMCREGETARVGQTLFILTVDEEVPVRRESFGIVGELPEAGDGAGVMATPAVRRLAREKGVDLSGIRGSGPRGIVTVDDLESTISHATVSRGPASDTRVPLRGMRRTIARNVLTSQRETASVTLMEEADITDLWAMREREQHELESQGIHLTWLPLFMKAAQHALKEHPYLNATIDDESEEIVLKGDYHFGIAMNTPDGLMVPVLRHVDRKSMLELAADIRELGTRAQERTILPDEIRGSSFTITNYGHFGGLFSTPIINSPDVAILGFGRITDRPWVYHGEIAIRKILPIVLSFDHRATDGVDAAQFLGKLVRYLEDTSLLLIECK